MEGMIGQKVSREHDMKWPQAGPANFGLNRVTDERHNPGNAINGIRRRRREFPRVRFSAERAVLWSNVGPFNGRKPCDKSVERQRPVRIGKGAEAVADGVRAPIDPADRKADRAGLALPASH